MPHFRKRLRTEQGILNFYFNRIYSADGERYHISVMDRSRKMQTFYMQEQRGGWKLIKTEDTPAWIEGMEEIFEQQIHDHLSGKYLFLVSTRV